jgi:hypothetical protein
MAKLARAQQSINRCLESPVIARTGALYKNLFDCVTDRAAYLGNPLGPPMFEAIASFIIVLSVGIFVAHALDAFRS